MIINMKGQKIEETLETIAKQKAKKNSSITD